MDLTKYGLFAFRAAMLWMCGCVVQVVGQQLFDCKKTGPCSCESDSGVIDLSALDSKSPSSPQFTATSPIGNTFYYNPCSPFSLTDQGCQNAAVCVQNGDVYSLIGTQDTADFRQDPTLGLQIVYLVPGSANGSSVQLLCDETVSQAEFTAAGEDPMKPGQFNMSLKSTYACPAAAPVPSGGGGGLSIGSILCIIFAVAVFVYLVAGVLISKYVVGARGIELIPNIYFWKELPLLVRDGVLFTINGCKPKDVNYDSI